MSAVTRTALRYHGAKHRLAPKIVEYFPEHALYVEPFGGAAGVLLHKRPSKTEVYNDLDGEIVNFWRVLRDNKNELIRRITCTPWARAEFELAYQHTDDPIESARRVAVRAWMGFGSAGATKGRNGFRTATRRGGNTRSEAEAWRDMPSILIGAAERLKSVVIENCEALKVMSELDGPETLTYLDPPYVHDTRSSVQNNGYYRHEMTDDQHRELLEFALQMKGMVLISGYPHTTYDEMLAGWQKVEFSTIAAGQRGSVWRTECLWVNPAAQRERGLF